MVVVLAVGVPGVSATPFPSASRYSFTVIPFRLVSPVPSLFVSAFTVPLTVICFSSTKLFPVLSLPPLTSTLIVSRSVPLALPSLSLTSSGYVAPSVSTTMYLLRDTPEKV